MYKKLFVLLACLLPTLLMAQTSDEKKFKLGFTTSPNLGWINFQNSQSSGDSAQESNGSKTGFSYGLIGDFGFSDNYYFSTGIVITSVNANVISPSISGASAEEKYKLQYLEVPLTVKLKSTENNLMRYYGQFGLSPGVNISTKKSLGTSSSNIDIAKDINSFRLGLLFGAGAEWKLGQNLNLLTGLSYNNGFTDILDSDGKAKNSYLALNLGIFF